MFTQNLVRECLQQIYALIIKKWKQSRCPLTDERITKWGQPYSEILFDSTKKWGFPNGSNSKESACNARDVRDCGSIPGLGRSPGGGHGNPLQYSCLENPID